jgi:O-antigen/teichoic acid export membrane protein
MKQSPIPQDNLAFTEGGVIQETRAAENLNRAIAKGALWMILARLGDRSLGFVSMIILVRLLSPDDFGLVAMATSVIALCELLGQVGLDVALIQNPSATRRHYDTAWTFSVIISTAIAVVLLIIAFPAANFYGEPRLMPILLSLAVGSFISGFENIGTVAFRKDLRFNKEFQFFFGKKLAAFLVTVPLALVLRSYWALIVGMVVGRLAGVGLSYYVQEYRPRWSFDARKELFHFSKWMLIFNTCNVFNGRAADFIVGKIAGAHALGVFNVSYELSNLPTSELIAPINRAVFPGYARKSENNNDLKQGYLDVIGMIAAIGIPAGAGIAATSNWVVPLLLGRQWTEAIPLIGVLAFYGVLTAMKTNAHYLYLALGKPFVATYLVMVQTCLLVPTLVVLTMRFGSMGAAYGYLIAQAVFTPVSFSVLFKVLGITARELLDVLWRPLASAACMFVAVRLFACVFLSKSDDNLSILSHLVVAAGCGTVTYASCLYILWRASAQPVGAESRILNVVQSAWFSLWLKSCQL